MKKYLLKFIVFFSMFTLAAQANDIAFDMNKIKEQHTFYGLASYYNSVNYYTVTQDKVDRVDANTTITLKEKQWFLAVGRFKVFVLKHRDTLVTIKENKLIITPKTNQKPFMKIVLKPDLQKIASELDNIRYFQLWTPLAWLSKVVESSLVWIYHNIVSNWGVVIIVFAILLKIFLLPVGIMTVRFQKQVSQVQSALAPILADIKQNYKGEEAHNKLMAAYKELGITPFYALKPMLGSFVQVPILIATFNALGEMPQFDGASFLWISNLAYPDAISHFSFTIPMFGNTLNLLPFLMTVVTIYSTIVFQNRLAPDEEVKKQKRNLYFMAFAFFVLFYPFPANMVWYWTLANILQFIQQKFLEIK